MGEGHYMNMSNKEFFAEDAIAVIGMSCRFPGAANCDEFWKNLRAGVTSISFFSDDELLKNGVPQEFIRNPDYVKAGYVLPDISYFDADFFGYTGKEAERIDPQHRLFLECTWEALEDAGYPPVGAGVADESVGVFVGSRLSTYMGEELQNFHRRKSSDSLQTLLGNEKDYLGSKIAYKLNLRGPCVMVQTACSSSLVAVHQACENIRNGCCDVAIAGGVAIQIPTRVGYMYQQEMILSPDGYCRAFDAAAGGTVFSNGVGVVVLKRYVDALADRDAIYAVVRGSSVNNDGGLRVGYTAPGLEGQAAVLSEAIGVSQVDPRHIGYIEAHGTGTAIGDPIEIEALTAAFRRYTQDVQFCPVGSVKANIGHTVTAAGI